MDMINATYCRLSYTSCVKYQGIKAFRMNQIEIFFCYSALDNVSRLSLCMRYADNSSIFCIGQSADLAVALLNFARSLQMVSGKSIDTISRKKRSCVIQQDSHHEPRYCAMSQKPAC